MQLATATFDILNQLISLLEQLDETEYCRPLDIISKNTVGKHVRHIVEFYEEMLKGYETGTIDYDARQRNLRLETDRCFVVSTLNGINSRIFNFTEDKQLKMNLSLNAGNEYFMVDTTFFREIAYNIEHTIHHFAIIKIAVQESFPDAQLPENFGVAYSTVKYQQTVCAQ